MEKHYCFTVLIKKDVALSNRFWFYFGSLNRTNLVTFISNHLPNGKQAKVLSYPQLLLFFFLSWRSSCMASPKMFCSSEPIPSVQLHKF